MNGSTAAKTPDGSGWSASPPAYLFTRGHGRPLALALLTLLLLAQIISERAMLNPVRASLFDAYQRLKPRTVTTLPVAIIAIDEDSLNRFGQWPWPRTWIARLVERTADMKPLAIGLDMVMPEADRLSPAALAADYPLPDSNLRRSLEALPSTDALFAKHIAALPVVVGRAGVLSTDEVEPNEPMPGAPIMIEGPDPSARIPRFEAQLVNLTEIEQAAAGHGYLNAIPDADGIVRRVPLLMTVNNSIAPSLALELLRVAIGANWLTVHSDAQGVTGVEVGDSFIPTDPDGGITLYFSPSRADRRHSAAAILSENPLEARLQNQIALIGVTALGLTDALPTPVAARMDGIEIQAQAIENILSGARLLRPGYMVWLESGVLVIVGLGLIAWLPLLRPALSLVPVLLLTPLLIGTGFAAFASARILIDPTYPVLAAGLLSLVLIAASWVETERNRRLLDARLEQERLETARLAGELNAARQIQQEMLPSPPFSEGLPPGLSIYALMEPAKEVGGDLYDAFMLDDRRLFFLVGDVSGKGVRAALFMAVSKALCRGAARRATGSIGAILSAANVEIADENRPQLYVTVVAGILDSATGALEFCTAGHASPLLLRPGEPPRQLSDAGGPPLCVLDDFPYPVSQTRIQPGDSLILLTDGVAEAMTADRQMYGYERISAFLGQLPAGSTPKSIATALFEDVKQFEGDAERTDDIAIMVIQYQGCG